jgi:hypothetical protein
MSFINWTMPFYLNPTTGETSYPDPDPLAGIVVPSLTYGNYGGGHYSEGVAYDGQLLTKPDGSPMGYNRLLAHGTGGEVPKDYLDFLNYRHDVLTSGPVYSPSADIDFLNRLIVYLSIDPEANLYAGFAELGMIVSLAIHDYLDELSPLQLIAGFTDAVNQIEYGLENLEPEELTLALNFLFVPAGGDVYARGFSITTTSFAEELLELTLLGTADAILDGDEGDPPLNTGFPFPGETDYQLVFTVGTHDLDLISV